MQCFEDESVMPPARSESLVAAVVLFFVLASVTGVGQVVAAEGEGVLSPEGAQRPFRATHCTRLSQSGAASLAKGDPGTLSSHICIKQCGTHRTSF